jgi:hypothetical protein
VKALETCILPLAFALTLNPSPKRGCRVHTSLIGFSLNPLSPLNPPMLGDFESGSPPALGGWGARGLKTKRIKSCVYTVAQAGRGTSIRLPFSLFGRRDWGMRARNFKSVRSIGRCNVAGDWIEHSVKRVAIAQALLAAAWLSPTLGYAWFYPITNTYR